jgi:hypothetical protein
MSKSGVPLQTGLPLLCSLRVPERVSLLVAILMVLASACGLLFPASIYTTAESFRSFGANDIVNLVLGLPILLVAIALALRGRLVGLLFWPGALLYVLYNYIAYAVGVPPGPVTALYAALIVFSLSATIVLVRRFDLAALQARLQGGQVEKPCGGALVVFGALFALRAVSAIGDSLARQLAIPPEELGVLLADLILCTAWVVVGVQLWRHKPLGYSLGGGLLSQASMLFLSLIGFLLLQPVLVGGPPAMMDVMVVAGLGMICLVPLALFARAAVVSDRAR